MEHSTKNVNLDELQKFNHANNDWWDLDGSFKPLHDINATRLLFITKHCALNNQQVLDVGCGGGIVAESLAKRHAKVTGLDMAENALNLARQHASEISKLEIDYVHGSVEDLSLEHPERFDTITCLEMLEHVDDPFSIIQACYRLLKPNGHIFFSTLNRTTKANLLGVFAAEKILKIVPKGTHDFNKFIRPSELAKFCEYAGLNVIDIQGIYYNPFTRLSYLSSDLSINYILYAKKTADSSSKQI